MLVRLAGAYTFPNGLSAGLVPPTSCDSTHTRGVSTARERLSRDGRNGPSYTSAV